MSSSTPPPTPPPSRPTLPPTPSPGSVRPYLWVLGLLWLLPAVCVVLGYLLLPDHNAGGQCEGLGFGCTPSPADGVLLMAILVGPWLVFAGALGCALVALVQAVRRWHRPR